jgi:DNA-binding FadR family transcriptional regulator
MALQARPRPVPGRGQKLAERVSQQIEADIIDMGWPIGAVVGSEAELVARYDVSRAVLREAIRLVEHHLVAKMRRGPGGGLVVTQPDPSAIVRGMALQMCYRQVTVGSLHEARVTLELTAVELATERLTDDGVAQIQAVLADEERRVRQSPREHAHLFHLVVASLTRNPVLELFIECLTSLTAQASAEPPGIEHAARELHRIHEGIASAICAGDVPTARARMEEHLQDVAIYLRASDKLPV